MSLVGVCERIYVLITAKCAEGTPVEIRTVKVIEAYLGGDK